MALAGFNKKDIEVEYADNQLTIKSIFEKDEADEEDIQQLFTEASQNDNSRKHLHLLMKSLLMVLN